MDLDARVGQLLEEGKKLNSLVGGAWWRRACAGLK